MRKCLEHVFFAIYVFNLRGKQRTSGELSRKEGEKIFGFWGTISDSWGISTLIQTFC